ERRTTVSSRAQNRGRHRLWAFPQRGALRGDARDGRTGTTERGDEGYTTHSLVDGFRRRCALRDPESRPHVGTYSVRGDNAGAGDRDDLGAFQHGRCADLQAVPRAST